MTGPLPPGTPTVFVSADWGKEVGKRSVWIADIPARSVLPAPTRPWTLTSLMELARGHSVAGPVLVGIDAVLGVSRGYWRLVRRARQLRSFATFVEWLRHLDPAGPFFGTTTDPRQWSADTPWFHVRSGRGGRAAFTEQMDDGFLRNIDRATNANPLFVVGGIPGTVGAGTRSLWQEMARLHRAGVNFATWPFEGELSALLARHRVVLGEIYPRLAYGAALADVLPAPSRRLAKGQRAARERACDRLQQARWVTSSGVDLGNCARASDNEDDFDAWITAAAVLRCVIEAIPLSNPVWIDSEAEGSMLLAGAIDLEKPGRAPPAASAAGRLRATVKSSRAANVRDYACPIPGCRHVFRGSRGGWDAHVASLRKHPQWHPAVVDPEARKRLFKKEHPDW